MKKRRILTLGMLVISLLPLLTGCWNMRELEHLFYAHAVGIDYKNKEYKVYVQILDFSTLGKTEGSSAAEGGTGSWVGKGYGSSLNAALHNLYASTQRRIFWGHLNTIILGENLLKHDYLLVLDQFTRFSELRYTPWVFATKDSMDKLLTIFPILERSPVYSQLSDPEDVFEQSSQITPVRLNRFLSTLHEPAQTPLLPGFGIAKRHWLDAKKQYEALEVTGAFVLRDRKLAGWLSKSAMIGHRFMDRKTSRAPMVVLSDGKVAANLTLEKIRPKVVPNVQGQKVSFAVKVTMKGNIVALGKDVSVSFIAQEVEKTVRSEIRHTFEHGLKIKTDPLQLLDALYRKQPAEWHRIKALGRFPLTPDSLDSIDVKVRITNAGKATKALTESYGH